VQVDRVCSLECRGTGGGERISLKGCSSSTSLAADWNSRDSDPAPGVVGEVAALTGRRVEVGERSPEGLRWSIVGISPGVEVTELSFSSTLEIPVP
jgi:hypothetical protein